MNGNHTNHNTTNGTKPIAIEVHRWIDLTNGGWRSCAFVKLTSALRTSGLLLALPAEDLKNLLFLLTFTSASGDCLPTVQQLAHAMNISERKVRRRMERLTQFRWQGKPLVTAIRRGNGQDAYTLATGQRRNEVLDDNETTGQQDHTVSGHEVSGQPSSEVSPSRPLARREEVIAASRGQYGRPRAAVEAEIAREMGWDQPPYVSAPPTNADSRPPQPGRPAERVPLRAQPSDSSVTAEEHIRQQLRDVGVEEEWVDYLMEKFDRERIQRQLQWLPYRKAQKPARMIVSAIEKDYEEPYALRPRKEGG